MRLQLSTLLTLAILGFSTASPLRTTPHELTDLSARDGGDTDPVMTDATGAIVPFDSSHVVTKEKRGVFKRQEDSDPTMTDATGAVVPFDSTKVVTKEKRGVSERQEDSDPTMTDATGTVVPFDSTKVVT